MPSDPHYPSVTTSFIDEQILANCPDIDKIEIGKTICYVTKGNKAIHKRTTIVRELKAQELPFEQAMSLAIKFKFIGKLIEWLTINRDFKEGGYIEPNK